MAALKWLAERMQQHDLSVTLTVQCHEPLPVTEEQAVLLFQSARELLMNVVKHAACKDAAVQLLQLPHELRVEVQDTGVGVQLPPQPAGGWPAGAPSKFGLFSIRERMKALGGSFELESAKGQGTRARLVLPLIDETLSRPAVSATDDTATVPPPTVRSAHTAIRVLLVDDHAMMRQGLRTVLESYQDLEVVGEAKDGEEALFLTEQLHPAVVIMDINMPRMNGIEATSRIKARRPHAVIIGLSVNAESQNVNAMLTAGASHLLTKEAAVEQLHAAILEAIGNESARSG